MIHWEKFPSGFYQRPINQKDNAEDAGCSFREWLENEIGWPADSTKSLRTSMVFCKIERTISFPVDIFTAFSFSDLKQFERILHDGRIRSDSLQWNYTVHISWKNNVIQD